MDNYFQYKFQFTQGDVIKFADASGDRNPVHLDNEYAKNTIFKRTILHGFLGGSIFSKVFGTINPGFGTIYLKQTMAFYKPMFTLVEYVAIFNVVEIYKDKNRALVKTEIRDSDNNLIIGGDALIQHESIK
jgi:3-hydroxybutyryl-CoA dehydratase